MRYSLPIALLLTAGCSFETAGVTDLMPTDAQSAFVACPDMPVYTLPAREVVQVDGWACRAEIGAVTCWTETDEQTATIGHPIWVGACGIALCD